MDFAINCSRVIGPYLAPGPARKRCHKRNRRACKARASRAESFRLRGLGDLQYSQNVAFEMSPAKLRLSFVVFHITGTAVAAKNSREHRAEQLDQHFGPARKGNLIEDEAGRDQSP